MLIRIDEKEYNAFRLRDPSSIVYFDAKNKKRVASTWDVQIYVNVLQQWWPFERAYGEYIWCNADMELTERNPVHE